MPARRVSLMVLAVTLLAALPAVVFLSPAMGQPQPIKKGVKGGFDPQPQSDFKPGIKSSAIKLIEDELYQKGIDNAVDALDGGAWQDACDYLQAILNGKQDSYVRIEVADKNGGKKSNSVSAKRHANILLATMPPEGLNAYELKFGAEAKQLLDKAKKTGSRETLADVAWRFLHTKAGAEANELLATLFLDRGDYHPAALRFANLLGPDPAKAKVSELTLFKATLAYKRAGDKDLTQKAQELEDVLYPRLQKSGGLSLANGKVATIKQVQAMLKEGAGSVGPANPHDWQMVGGNLARNAQAKGSPPMLDYVLWSRPTLMDKSDESGEPEAGSQARKPLTDALNIQKKNANMPIMSGGFPIASNGILFYRSYAGITAVYLHDILDKDGNVESKAGSVHWRSTPFEGALGSIFDSATMSGPLDGWIKNIYETSGFTNILYENSTVGTLTTDGRSVFAVDDLALPIPPKYLPPNNFWNSPTYVHDDLKKLVLKNRLKAYNIVSGKIEWELGGDANKVPELTDSLFLCAPVSVGGKLYVLNEKNSGDLRLLCLDPATGKLIGAPQKLGTVRNEFTFHSDIARRANAIHLAYAEGILVCPTNAGEILGVDLMTQSLAWAYKYRDKPPNPRAFPLQFDQQPRGVMALSYANWKVAPPILVDGKVVFTAPDSSAVCCVNLRTGEEVWTAPQQESDLFLAGVYQEKVVIVGKHSIRAVRLADGAPAWSSLQTGDFPSGQGVASNNVYYLPLKNGEICAVDLTAWSVKAHNRPSKAGGEPPGNLVFCEGMVLSQTPEAIVAYPQLVAKLAEAEIAYNKDPSVKNLLHRGELRLADGQVNKAVDDLLGVVAKSPAAEVSGRAKDQLYEALGQLLQVDFANTAPKYLKDYKELTKVEGNPTEQLKREAKYWRLVGKGREQQGDLVEAFLAYKQYGASPLFRDAGIPSLEDPLYKVPTHLWFRGRISAMFAKATPAQRQSLEKKIAEEWLAVKKQNNMESIRQFTLMFDVPFIVGREARIELADAIIQNKAKDSFLEAELDLLQLRLPAFRGQAEVGGKALAALARLETAKGTEDALRLALVYYREIDKEFGKAVLHDGKTGSELFQAAIKDPRFKPFLKEQTFSWGGADIKWRKFNGAAIPGIRGFIFQPEGDVTPLMQQYRLVLDPVNNQNPVLRLVDAGNTKQRWSITLPASQLNYSFFTYLYDQTRRTIGFHPNAKFRFYQIQGHLGVIQVGMLAYGIDLDSGKVLWQYELYDPNKVPQPNFGTSFAIDERDRMWLVHNNQPGQPASRSRIGQIGAVQPTYVALVTQKGLVVLDPVKGTTLWTKTGLLTNTEVFGDDQHIYYVETADGAAVGAGRCLRASDGAPVDIPDFGFFYRHQQRIVGGRQILTAEPIGRAVTMRLYDVPTGKEVWKQTFTNDPAVLQTEDADRCGVIERDTGKLILVDAGTGKEIMTANMKQFRVSAEDLKELYQPLILDDGDNYFVALNTKHANAGILNNNLSNNIESGTRCLPVNGWFCCLDRTGQFLWHGTDRLLNQMIVVEQFKVLPILLFSSRYSEQQANFNSMYIVRSSSFSKSNGKAIWSSEDSTTNPNARFYAFNLDLKTKTINMIGFNETIQHYVDDGKPMKKGKVPKIEVKDNVAVPVPVPPPAKDKDNIPPPKLAPPGAEQKKGDDKGEIQAQWRQLPMPSWRKDSQFMSENRC